MLNPCLMQGPPASAMSVHFVLFVILCLYKTNRLWKPPSVDFSLRPWVNIIELDFTVVNSVVFWIRRVFTLNWQFQEKIYGLLKKNYRYNLYCSSKYFGSFSLCLMIIVKLDRSSILHYWFLSCAIKYLIFTCSIFIIKY